jgi:hypothetical protein
VRRARVRTQTPRGGSSNKDKDKALFLEVRRRAREAADKASLCKHGEEFCDDCDDSDNPRWEFSTREARGEKAYNEVFRSAGLTPPPVFDSQGNSHPDRDLHKGRGRARARGRRRSSRGRGVRTSRRARRSTSELIAAVLKATGMILKKQDRDYTGFLRRERGYRIIEAAVAKGAITSSEASDLRVWTTPSTSTSTRRTRRTRVRRT